MITTSFRSLNDDCNAHDDDYDNHGLTNKTKQLSFPYAKPNCKNSHAIQIQEGLLQIREEAC